MKSALQLRGNSSNATHTGPSQGLTPSVRRDLTDCHAAEHLLVGTHSLDTANDAGPVCLTCRFQSRAA